jgi:hypothetical protein
VLGGEFISQGTQQEAREDRRSDLPRADRKRAAARRIVPALRDVQRFLEVRLRAPGYRYEGLSPLLGALRETVITPAESKGE